MLVISTQFIIYSSNICNWFDDNKLNIQFRNDETKSNIFSSKNTKNKDCKIRDKIKGDINTRQCSKVCYLGFELDENIFLQLKQPPRKSNTTKSTNTITCHTNQSKIDKQPKYIKT